MEAPPPPRVARPVMYHHWNWITFLHWRYPPAVVQRLLPPDSPSRRLTGRPGSGWPVPHGPAPAPGLPAVPWLSRFGEINVRTYVHDRTTAAGSGSSPSTRRACLPLRPPGWATGCPTSGPTSVCESPAAGRLPLPPAPGRGARCDAEVALGPPLAEAERDELAHFLTARYRLFTMVAGRLAAAEAEHLHGRCTAPRRSAWTRTCCSEQDCRRLP